MRASRGTKQKMSGNLVNKFIMKTKPVTCKASLLVLLLTIFVCVLPFEFSFTMGFSAFRKQISYDRACRFRRISPVFASDKSGFFLKQDKGDHTDNDDHQAPLEWIENDESVTVNEDDKMAQTSEEATTLRNNFLIAYLDLLGTLREYPINEEISTADLSLHARDFVSLSDLDNALDEMILMCELDYYFSLQPDDPQRMSVKIESLESLVGPPSERRFTLMKIAEVIDYRFEDDFRLPAALVVLTTIMKLSWELSVEPEIPQDLDWMPDFLQEIEERLLKYKEGAQWYELQCFSRILEFMQKRYEIIQYELDE